MTVTAEPRRPGQLQLLQLSYSYRERKGIRQIYFFLATKVALVNNQNSAKRASLRSRS